MIKELTPMLLIGDDGACYKPAPDQEWNVGGCLGAVVHACKYPCWHDAARRRAGYHTRTSGKFSAPAPDHPDYLSIRDGNHLYLNLVDPEVPLFYLESFRRFLDFAATTAAADRALLIHCNQGLSRSPSLALLWMAKQGQLRSGSFDDAVEDFRARIHPGYRPGNGVITFLRTHWERI